MTQAGIIKTTTGSASARTSDGLFRQLTAGDMIYENEIIETAAGAKLTIELNDGRTLNLAENSQIVIDETVVAAVEPQDAVVKEVQELQAALEAGEEIPDEETAAGEEDEGFDYNLAYYAGDQSRGDVGSYLFGTGYNDEDEDFPDIEGQEEELVVTPTPAPEPAPAPEPTPEPEYGSMFIIGSNPDEQGAEQYSNGDEDYHDQEKKLYTDDVKNPIEADNHAIYPADGDTQGAILGQNGADTLVGDPGSISYNKNYIVVMDLSSSMTDNDGLDTTRLQDLQGTTRYMVEKIYAQVLNNPGGEVTVTFLPFATGLEQTLEITFTNQNDTVQITGSITGIDTLESIDAWINNLNIPSGLNGVFTNYQAALEGALANATSNDDYIEDHVIFLSDGSPTFPNTVASTYASQLAALQDATESIHSIGIRMEPEDTDPTTIQPINYLNDIDDAGSAANAENQNDLDAVIDDILSEYHLGPAGSDEISGNDGNDLIFGDVLNTDGVFEDLENDGYDLSTIKDLPDGSGWEVFETLENELSNWTRTDTVQYIRENHEGLAKETVLGTETDDGGVRDGGHDYIEGGAGDDIIYGQEGDDTIDAGSGHDIVDGGSGFDTLVVTAETELDFSNVSNIERIDLNEDGVPQTITLSLHQVLSMTDENNILQITGEEGDSVRLTGVESGEWNSDGNGLFTNTADNSIQVTITPVDDNVDIDVNVDNADSFKV